jgi:hypothetical protein
MQMRFGNLCWIFVLVLIACPKSVMANEAFLQKQREKSLSLRFKTHRIEKLPSGFTASPYRLGECVRDLYPGEEPTGIPTLDTISTLIEKPDGQYWAAVYQMRPPKQGDLQCNLGYFDIPKYCYPPFSRSCEEAAQTHSGVTIYQAPPDLSNLGESFYITLNGTLVIFAFFEKTTPEEMGQLLEAVESMRLFSPSALANQLF